MILVLGLKVRQSTKIPVSCQILFLCKIIKKKKSVNQPYVHQRKYTSRGQKSIGNKLRGRKLSLTRRNKTDYLLSMLYMNLDSEYIRGQKHYFLFYLVS
jgi:hypothetical protein